MRTQTPNDGTELDVRTIDGDPFDRILTALDDLDAGETLVLINSFEPVPLFDVLTQRGFGYESERVASDEWHVRIEHAG